MMYIAIFGKFSDGFNLVADVSVMPMGGSGMYKDAHQTLHFIFSQKRYQISEDQ